MNDSVKESEYQNQFIIEEYKALRIEIQNLIVHTRKIIYFNIVFTGLIWSFYLTEELSFNFLIKWIPTLIVLLSAGYNYSIEKDIKKIGDYIHKIENVKLKNSDLGWEKHLRMKSIGWKSMADYWEKIFWVVLLIVNLIAALVIV
jgi:hypothetical protein